jgi:hypothetical protein
MAATGSTTSAAAKGVTSFTADFAPGEDFVNLIAFDELGSLET